MRSKKNIPWEFVLLPWMMFCTSARKGSGQEVDAPNEPRAVDRTMMIQTIEDHLRQVEAEPGLPRAFRKEVLAAMQAVPRHAFVPDSRIVDAYRDMPLEIGSGQTISQPFMVALMTELSRAGPGAKVLEVGTGSGYQAAVLARMGADVYTIEIVEELGRTAKDRLARLNVRGVHCRIGDGYAGWPKEAPFDAIIVTAAPDHVPQPLIDQLAVGGRLIIPVGPVDGRQELIMLTKDAEGSVETERVTGVRFVPLTRTR